ncbi:MAG: CcdB family protein [Granulosicoccus sp.]
MRPIAQFDVHKNASKKTSADFPYLLEIQSDLFEDSSRIVVIPLVHASACSEKDSTLNPEFDINALSVLLFPLDISSMDRSLLGDKITSLRMEGDRIIAALDLLFARF